MRHAGCHSNGESIVGDRVALGYEVFSPADDKDLVVALDAAEPGSPPERGLHQLARGAIGASSPLRPDSAALGG
jgi:hypothetical protein